MNKKNSKYLAVFPAMLVFSMLLTSCQSTLATTKEMEQSNVPWVELRSDVPFKSEEMEQASARLLGESNFES